jgi:hypothetical protein
MKRTRIRLAIVSAVASVSLLGLSGLGAVDHLAGGNVASRIGGSYCC